jgi:hypothetical protein
LPANSIDTFFACSLIIILTVSAMAAMPRIMYPFLDGLAHRNDAERLQQLAQYILLSTGTPTDWGSSPNAAPTAFGLASNSATQPYALDMDKVTRLNSGNRYAINYASLLDALKVSNIALRIQIQPLFNTSISLTSSTNEGNETSYDFEVTTENSGLAVASSLSCYLVVRDYVDNLVSSTNSNGKANITFTISNSINGTVLLVVFAQSNANSNIASFSVYPFAHNASIPEPNGTFTRLDPLNYVLNASFNYPQEHLTGVFAFSYSYWTNLALLSNATQTTEHAIPRFLDKSVTVLVLTGLNDTKSFAEWVAYPQIPLEIGVNFDSSSSNSSVASFSYVVAINSMLYELQTKCRAVG